MSKKKIGYLAGLACILILCLMLFGGGEKQQLSGELLENGDFSLLDENGMPEGWYTDAYVHTPGYSDFSVSDGEVTIVNHELNDARFVQNVQVNPDSLYCLSGYVRASAAEGLGANLSIEGVYVFSDSLYDTRNEWKELRLYGRTDKKQTSVTIYARLGGYSGEAIGSASFRNLSLVEVQSVPVGYLSQNWFAAQAEPENFEEDENGSSAWPVLVLIAALYAAVCSFLARHVLTDPIAIKREPAIKPWLAAAFMLLLAFAARIVVAMTVPGYGVDVGCFTAWANMMAQGGAADFYVSDVFCDYPPGYILVLGFIGWIGKLLGTGATELMIKLPSILCDVAAAALVYAFARRRVSERTAFAAAAVYAFNPLTFIAGAAWGQADSVMTLGILLVVMLAIDNRWYAVLPVYVVSVLMKPQALMFGPLGLLALMILLMTKRDKKLVRDMLIGLGVSVIVGLVVVLPFSVKQENPLWLVELYRNTMGYYDSATVNACNLHFLFGSNWLPIKNAMPWYVRAASMVILCGGAVVAILRAKLYCVDLKNNKNDVIRTACAAAVVLFALLIVCIPMTYGTYGTCCIVLVVLCGALLYIAGGDVRHLPLLGGVMLLALCNLGVMMHERYLFTAVALLLLSCILTRDKRVYLLFVFTTIAVFLNVGCVLDRGIRIGGVEGHLHAPVFGIESDSAVLEYAVSFVNCALTAYAVYAASMICCAKQTALYTVVQTAQDAAQKETFNRAKHSLERENALQKMHLRDWLLMGVVTIVYAVAAFTNLGSTVSPQTMWMAQTRDETIVLDLGETRTMNMLYFGGIHSVDSDFYIQVSDDGVVWNEGFWAKMSYGDCFKWQYVTTVYEYNDQISYANTPREITGRYVMITSRQLGTTLYEVILRDPQTQAVFPVTVIEGNGEALIDEQNTFSGEPGWYNSTYFDEIYHARTGYEHYMAMQGDNTYYPYETSHPPLGKVLMAFAISIFGMTPFGWRFAGALAGVLMLPGMYMLGKLLTKRRSGAFAAMFLMAVDLMHFTQTRIATIDSFVVLFIIWSYVFMLYYVRMDYWRTKFWKTLVPLAFSGLFMGLGVASKWTGCYAGVGLAVLFFWSVWRRFDEYSYAKNTLAAADEKLSKKERKHRAPIAHEALLKTVSAEGVKRPMITLLCCLVFFVAVPLLIYYVSYIPYFMPSGGITVERVIQAAVGDYFDTGRVGGMLGYHGTPGLGMDHPYYSPWYEWPVIGKPMWYYQSTYHPDGYTQTIFAMGNPAVWIGGMIALIAAALVWLLRHVSGRGIQLHNQKNDMRPALILISFAAQYLPWVLVPRGTYIYHYFTDVPFIIAACVLCFDYLLDITDKPFVIKERTVSLKKAAWVLLAIYLALALVMFVGFYPYASGAMTDVRWLRMMQWFDGWIYF